MNNEELRQRIQYLTQHGGVYPEAPPAWRVWAALILAAELGHLMLELIEHLR